MTDLGEKAKEPMSEKKLQFIFNDVVAEITPAMIEEVARDYEREHPGMNSDAMTSAEFADRLMDKFYKSARPISAPGKA